MKRLFAVLFTALLLSTALCATASASNFDSAAKELAAIGMFRGTNNGFALDRAPTRAEAAIMLVRLYGAEAEAGEDYNSGKISHPFIDVPDYAAPHVAWLYSHSIAYGTGANTFSAASKCSLQNYMTFLMRCLGYQDGTDFQYANVVEFAEGKGLMDTSAITGTFLRDDLVALTYQALSCDLKDGSTYLLDSLVKSGAVSAEAAKPITNKIETYRSLEAASSEMEQALDVNLDANVNVAMTASGVSGGQPMNETMNMPINLTGRIQTILDKSPQMAVVMTGTADGQSMENNIWLKDGWMYTQSDGQSVKMNLGNQIEDIFDSYQGLVSSNQISSMLPFIDTITSTASGGNTVYTLTLNDAFTGLLDGIVDLVTGSMDDSYFSSPDMNIRLDQCRYTYTLDSSGHLTQIGAAIKLSMTYAMNINAQNNIAVNAELNMDMTMSVNAVGSSVVISYPDFSGFVDMTNS